MLDKGQDIYQSVLFEQDKVLAENSTPNKNELLNSVFIAYYMGWRHLINPESRDLSVLYNGMGPDVSTVLLATDATEITSIDPKHPDVNELAQYLENWEILDTDFYNLPGNINVLDDEVRADPTEDKLNNALKGILKNKAISGHWDSLDISALNISRCLLIELKRLGVQRDSVVIESDSIEFDWAFPGDQPKKRKIIFGANYLESFIEDNVANQKYDGFYEKSIMTGSVTNNSELLTDLEGMINDEGFMLVGSGNAVDLNNLHDLSTNTHSLELPNSYDTNVLASYPGLTNGYTYQLNGVRLEFNSDEVGNRARKK